MARRDLIRSLARQRLNGTTRAVFDSEDIFSTVLGRMDALAARGVLRIDSQAELNALLARIVANSTANKVRLIERSRSLVAEDGVYASLLVGRLLRCADDDEATLILCRMVSWLESPENRQILTLRLRGMTHAATAQALNLSHAAVRQRWQTIRATLQRRIARGDLG